ncbi:MAG TPA: hypothetical protein VHB99_16225 [Pirellulales bacterium]|nr:hypothetical protein [Pirellulales bacterium]
MPVVDCGAMLTGMGKPRFSLRALFVATAAIAALFASALVENPIATSLMALVAAIVLPAALMTAAIRGRGYLQTFAFVALAPAAMLSWFVMQEAQSGISVLSDGADPFGPPADSGPPYLIDFLFLLADDVRYLPFGFGLASIVAGLTAVATHWLLGEAGEGGK